MCIYNQYILEAKQLYFDLSTKKGSEGKKVILVWVPTYIGIQGNEAADKLAKEATREESNNDIKIPIKDFKIEYKNTMMERTRNTLGREKKYKGKVYFEKNIY